MKHILVGERKLTALVWDLAGCLIVAAMLGGSVAEPFVDRLVKPGSIPPVTRAAIEGKVWISDRWYPQDTGAYRLNTDDGRSIEFFCGPWPDDQSCLHLKGLEPGRVYRLTIGYYSQKLDGGIVRNVIAHVKMGDVQVLTPQEQVQAWQNLNVMYHSKRGRYGTIERDGFFWAVHAVISAIFIMAVVRAFICLRRIGILLIARFSKPARSVR